MAKNTRRQYTIRNVPDQVDSILRQRAEEMGKSLNQILLDALWMATSLEPPRRDLSDIVGTISAEEARRMDREVRNQRRIDPELWQ